MHQLTKLNNELIYHNISVDVDTAGRRHTAGAKRRNFALDTLQLARAHGLAVLARVDLRVAIEVLFFPLVFSAI
jgi:hypothetical protein